jgi:hypothetical protein
MSLPSPQYIRSVVVKNYSDSKYNIWLQLDDGNQPGKQFNICGHSCQKYEFTYQQNGASFVYPIKFINMYTNSGCGIQASKYSLSANDVSSVVNVVITIDYCGNVNAVIN